MNKQRKTLQDYKVESKYNEEDRARINEKAKDYCDELNNSIDSSLDNSLAMCANTAKLGMDTCEELHDQRNRIRNLHKNVHEIDETLKDSERSIQTVQSWRKGIVVKY